MKRSERNVLVAALGGFFAAIIFVCFLAPLAAQGQGLPAMTKQVPNAVSSMRANLVGQLPSTQVLHLAIMLPLQNQSELDQLLRDLYVPESSSYHQWLSVQEFTDRFGPTQEQYNAVLDFAKANGLTVTGTYPNRLVVDVSGTAANIEQAFNVNLNVYQHPTENRTFFAPDREPTTNLPFQLWHIAGLSNYSIPRPASLHMQAAGIVANATGSGPGGNFIGSDMRAAYYGGTPLTGSGQSVGLFELGGYNPQDVSNYFSAVGQTNNVTIVPVSVDQAVPTCTNGSCEVTDPKTGLPTDGEQALDIEYAISMAPGMSQVRVYVGPETLAGAVDVFNTMAVQDTCKSLSCSWGWAASDLGEFDTIFTAFATQGQTLFAASGDDGSYPNSTGAYYPSEDANVTSVGGTNLVTTGPGGAWESATVWNQQPYGASGGGISPDKIPIPSYQTIPGVITSANGGSTVYRNCPDVAANAQEDNYICYDGTCAGGWGGTSFAAPLWAGYLALANQQAVSSGYPTLGFINNAIYKFATHGNYSFDFHDITSGNNGAYSATTGYDLATGLGSPNGGGLIAALVYTSQNTLWQGAAPTGNGWYYLSWFGYFYIDPSGWINHDQLGWLYPDGSSTNNIWFFYPKMNNVWVWTSQTQFPYLQRSSDNATLWYEEWTTNPCWFMNLTTNQWESY